jgi:hypothetical protein
MTPRGNGSKPAGGICAACSETGSESGSAARSSAAASTIARFAAEIFNSTSARSVCDTKESKDLNRKEFAMLWTIFVILLVLWLLGLVSSYTMGGFIHLLLVIAVVVLIIQLISGRRPL